MNVLMLAEISKADAASSYDRREEQKIEGWLLIAEIAKSGFSGRNSRVYQVW